MRISIVDFSVVGFAFCETEAKVCGLLSRLSRNQTALQQNPLAVLNAVYEEYGRSCETFRKRADEEVLSIELRTGMTSVKVQGPKEAEGDLSKLNKASHAANANLIFLDNVTNFDVALGKFIKEIFVKLETMRLARNLEPLPVHVSQALHQNIDHLINLSEQRRCQALSLHRRVQSQISVVSKTN